MRITFGNPAFLSLLLLVAPLVIWLARHSQARGGSRRRAASAALRGLILTLLICALARMQLVRQTHQLAILILIDRSGSVTRIPDERILAQLEKLLSQRGPRTEVGVILFGKQPLLAIPPSPDLTLAQVAAALKRPIDGSQTNLEGALRLAILSFPPQVSKRIVLISDGNQTVGEALPLVAQLTQQQVQVAVYPMQAAADRRISIAPIRLSTRQAFLGESVELSIRIRSNRAVNGELQIEVTHSRPESLRRKISLAPGKNGPFRFTLVTREKGPHHLKAIFRPDRSTRPPITRTAFLSVAGTRPRVLLIEGTPGKERFLAEALNGEQITVETRPPVGCPTALWDLIRYDCFILSDVPATMLSREQMKLIRYYVEQRGGAFVMVGGLNSFGRGGYYRTPIQKILPVRIEIPQKLEIPSMAIVLAIDKSGSMSGKKMELAKDAAMAVVELLGRKDWIGVTAFDSSASWPVPLQKVISRSSILEAIAKVEPGGGTYFYPALQQAYDALLRVKAKLKHVILLSDGHTNAADYQGLVTRMALERITVSTVAVGNAAEVTLMRRIAGWGHGRYYFTQDEHNIPQIFTQETIKVSKRSLKEIPFRPEVYHRHQIVRGIDFRSGPYLQGYVVTRARPTAEVPLVYRGDPILALWRVGLGQVATFTSDAKDRWAPMWLEWSGFPKLWGQLVRHLIRKKIRAGGPSSQRVRVNGQLQVTPRGQTADIRLDLVDPQGKFVNHKVVTATLTYQGQTGQPGQRASSQTVLRQVAPGRYQADARLSRPGTYLVQVRAQGTDLLESADFELSPTGEALSGVSVNHGLLRAIASQTGGAVKPTAAAVTKDSGPPQERSRALWSLLALIALCLLPLDIALRRLMLDRSHSLP